MKKSLKKLVLLALSVALVVVTVLACGCADTEVEAPIQEEPTPTTQINEDITLQEAFTLIEENQDNPDFMIIDVRTPGEFAEGYIENAISLDYHSETFRDELDRLDRDKTYLVYCKVGIRSRKALDIMAELNFSEAYNMMGGMDQWEAEGLPVVE